ncbi:MAG: hypothetical protein N2444_04525 [Methylocystis sp.]|nr:hypothetical protein [Methylocystis sp.]
MHPDLEGYVWITIKALGVALVASCSLRIGYRIYDALISAA